MATSKEVAPISLTWSFAEVIGGTALGSLHPLKDSIPLKKPSSHRGEPAILFSNEDIVHLSPPFKLTLIGWFSHDRPPLTEIRSAFVAFDLKVAFTIGILDYKYILIRFTYEGDFYRIWLRNQLFINKFPKRIFKWEPNFRVDAESTIFLFRLIFPIYLSTSFPKKVFFLYARS